MASTLDLTPTLLDFAGITEPEGVQGVSMRGVLAGEIPSVREATLTENDDDFVPMRTRTLTTARWKLTHYVQQPLGELFDRQNDPGEMVNLWDHPEYQPVKHDLMQDLLEEVIFSQDMANGRVQSPQPLVPKWSRAMRNNQHGGAGRITQAPNLPPR
jgi:arylsulfatase A-like enzyme